MATLDKSKPYGTIHGDSRVSFEQGGKYFNAECDEVGMDEVSQTIAEIGATRAPEKAKAAKTEIKPAVKPETSDADTQLANQ